MLIINRKSTVKGAENQEKRPVKTFA